MVQSENHAGFVPVLRIFYRQPLGIGKRRESGVRAHTSSSVNAGGARLRAPSNIAKGKPMYTSGTKDEHGEKRLSDVRAAMRSQQEKSQATRLVGLALADQRSQLDARARWWQRLAARAPVIEIVGSGPARQARPVAVSLNPSLKAEADGE